MWTNHVMLGKKKGEAFGCFYVVHIKCSAIRIHHFILGKSVPSWATKFKVRFVRWLNLQWRVIKMEYSLELISYEHRWRNWGHFNSRTEKTWRYIAIFTGSYLFQRKRPAKELRDLTEGTVLRGEISRWELHSPNVLVTMFSIRL